MTFPGLVLCFLQNVPVSPPLALHPGPPIFLKVNSAQRIPSPLICSPLKIVPGEGFTCLWWSPSEAPNKSLSLPPIPLLLRRFDFNHMIPGTYLPPAPSVSFLTLFITVSLKGRFRDLAARLSPANPLPLRRLRASHTDPFPVRS